MLWENISFDLVEQYEGNPDSKDCLAANKNKQYKNNKIMYHYYRLYKLFFYIVATNIQALVVPCDEFLCVCVIDLCCQSI
jgi:hypothetical protein